MRKFHALFFCLLAFSAGQDLTTPRHLIGAKGPLTAASSRAARDIAREYTLSSVPGVDVGSLYIAREYTDEHNGVTHILYRQQFQGIDVVNAAWVVNVDSQGRILNAGGSIVGAPSSALPDRASALSAARAAARIVNPDAARSFQPFFSQKAARTAGAVRFTRGQFGDELEGRLAWYAVNGQARAAWIFTVTDTDGVHRYQAVVDGNSYVPLARRPLTFFQSPRNARGLVFTAESPNPNPKPGVPLTGAPPFVDRVSVSFNGDLAASPRGWVTDKETAGNNTTAGANPLGISFLLTPLTAVAPDGDFAFPLSLGPDAPNPTAFEPAITTNLFYWMNRSHDLFYKYGFTEAAGNFQKDNLNKGGVGGDAVLAYSHFGSQGPGRAQLSNAFFTTATSVDDGDPAEIAMYISSTGRAGYFTDGSLDSIVMVHEYAHGVSIRLLPDGYDTFQNASMGEGWSDFYGLEFTLPEGAPTNGSYNIGEYFQGVWGQSPFRSRPYSTDLGINPLTFADIGAVIPFPEVHADGEIWFSALWDVRANLMQQFGEKEGRERVRRLLLDGMKLMPPAASMVDARDAILLADRTTYKGASQRQLWAGFAKRGLGVTAYSTSGDTVHIHASFDVPSGKTQVAFYDSPMTVGETIRLILADANVTTPSLTVRLTSSSGDVEQVVLRKQGSVFVGAIASTQNVVNRNNGTLNIMNGDRVTAFYEDYDTGAGEFELVSATIDARPSYTFSSSATPFDPGGSNERLVVSGQRVELPFAFPFFDKKYKSVFVDENGILMFGDTRLFACTDVPRLASIPAIAPFWMQLTTEGIAQPREGIYYSQKGPGAVQFRWAGETFTPFTTPGAPVNFEVTLVDDGAITINFGPGNTGLETAVTPSFCGPGPTVGISPGHDSHVRTVISPNWNNSGGVRYDPPFNHASIPELIVETPAVGDHAQDVLTVSGVAWDTVARATRVDVYIDGVQRGSVVPNQPRADFCAKQTVPGCPAIGWSLSLNTSSLTPGPHKVHAVASNTRAAFKIAPDEPIEITIDAGRGRLPFGKIESPAAGATVNGTLLVRGYVAAADLRIAVVDTIIDGVTYGPTQYGFSRTDICTPLNPRPLNCPAIGFQLSINTRTGNPPLTNGDHTLQVRVRDETGRYTYLPDAVTFTVNNTAYEPPVGAITSVKSGDKLTGTVTISGYAYAPGSTIRQVVVFFDIGDQAYPARYGTAAPEVCEALPDVPACPNIGWTLDLDTTKIPNGPHTLNVRLVNARGESSTLPGVGQPTISIVVQN